MRLKLKSDQMKIENSQKTFLHTSLLGREKVICEMEPKQLKLSTFYGYKGETLVHGNKVLRRIKKAISRD